MDDAFLRAIRADPEADLPRLVYADWLDEHDDPARAEFVRVQCELAKLPDHDAAYAALEDREHELLAEHEAKWLGDGPTPDEWTFRRGFVDELRLDPAAPPSGEWLTRQAVTSVTLAPRALAVTAEAVLSVPGLEGLQELDVSPASRVWLMDDLYDLFHAWDTPGNKSLLIAGMSGLSQLGRHLRNAPLSRSLGRLNAGGLARVPADHPDHIHAASLFGTLWQSPLESLTAYDSNLTSLAPLLNAGFAGSLSSLDVSHNPLAADAYREFVAADPKLKLKHLDVSGTALCGPTLSNLLASRCCETLTGLAVNNAEPYLSDLVGTPFWGQAVDLSLHRCGVRDASFQRLARSTGPPALRSLDLGDNSLGVDGVRWLCEAAWARPITWLNLAASSLDFHSVRLMSQPGALPHLRTLHLGYNAFENSGVVDHQVDDDALVALIRCPTLTRLRVLTLTANPVSDYGVELLMNAPHFTLSGLGLSHTQVTAGGVRRLAKSPRLSRLNWLDLSDNAALRSDALLPLAESPYLSPLCDLDISRTGASAFVRDLLRQRLGRRLLD